MKKLSIVIPVFNEAATIRTIVDTVKSVPLEGIEKELVLVDDCSSAGTRKVLEELAGVQPRAEAAAEAVSALKEERKRLRQVKKEMEAPETAEGEEP